MADRYDVVVIGAGPAGEAVAGRCADGGLSVAIAERELVGGECSYWGCIPSKTLIRPGDVLAATSRVPGAASTITGHVDIDEALARRDYMTAGWDDGGQVPWLDDHHVDLVRGTARIVGPLAVDVESDHAATTHLEADRAVVVATGTTPAMPPIEGLSEVGPWDNRTATSAHALPRRLLVLGGGAIGCEIAQAFKRLGTQDVSVIEGAERLLPREEPFASDEVASAFGADGIDVTTGAAISSVRRDSSDGAVAATLADGREVRGDEILVAVGRRPHTSDIGLKTVGLQPGRFIDVDDQLRARGVREGWLYAVGDCNGRALFTHMGKYQARLAADVILGKEARDVADAAGPPRVTFTDPQVCAVGLTEEQARRRGQRVRCVTHGTGDVSGASVLGEGVSGTAKLVVDEDRRALLGATFVGPGLQELLHSATVAVTAGVTLEQLWHAVPSFPTVSELWLRLLEAYGL